MNCCFYRRNTDINKSIHRTRKKTLQQFLSSDESPQSLAPSHNNCFDMHFPLSQRKEPKDRKRTLIHIRRKVTGFQESWELPLMPLFSKKENIFIHLYSFGYISVRSDVNLVTFGKLHFLRSVSSLNNKLSKWFPLFRPVIPFYTHWKCWKISSYWMFPVGTERKYVNFQ